MQFDISPQVSTLSDAIQSAINELYPQVLQQAESSPDESLDLDEGLLQSVVDTALEQNDEVRQAVFNATQQLEPNATENGAIGIQPVLALTLAFFVKKTLQEAISRIHAATVFRQVIESDRQEHIDKALQRSLALAEDVALNELGSYAATYDELDATENGYQYYQYQTSEDEVVRSSHQSRNGKYFRYGSARVVDDIPSQAYRCRCVAISKTLEEALTGDFFYSEDKPIQSMNKPPIKDGQKLELKYRLSALGMSGDIGDWVSGGDFDTFRYFAADEFSRTGELNIDMTTHGGVYQEGAAMYSYLNQMKAEGKRITFNVVGYCGSAGTLPMCAADHVTADISDSILIHNATGGYIGQAEGFDAARDETIDANTTMMEIYRRKTGRTEKEIRELMAENRYITATRALEFGLIDEIRGQTPINPSPSSEGFFNGDDSVMADVNKEGSDSNDDYLLQIGALKEQLNAANEANETLKAENKVLAQKLEEVPDEAAIAAMVDEKVTALKVEADELTALKTQVSDIGLKASGVNAHELRVNALRESGIDGVDAMSEAAVAGAFSVLTKYASKAADTKAGGQILGREKQEEKQETGADIRARLMEDK